MAPSRDFYDTLGVSRDVSADDMQRAYRKLARTYHPDVIKDHVWTQTGGDCFPYTPRTATRDGVDYDHAIPYDDTGPPGQTGPHNCGPLRRSHHRTKTHSGLTTSAIAIDKEKFEFSGGFTPAIEQARQKLLEFEAAANDVGNNPFLTKEDKHERRVALLHQENAEIDRRIAAMREEIALHPGTDAKGAQREIDVTYARQEAERATKLPIPL